MNKAQQKIAKKRPKKIYAYEIYETHNGDQKVRSISQKTAEKRKLEGEEVFLVRKLPKKEV